ncbi:MAG: hypothetical protein ABIP75_05390 [Pyrinomonadaceae bacterium]
MSKIFIAICILWMLTISAYAQQQINLAKPIVASLSDAPPDNAEQLEMRMRTPEPDEIGTVTTNAFRISKCIASDNNKRKIEIIPIIPNGSDPWRCLWGYGSDSSQLSQNWATISLRVEYSYVDPAGATKTDRYTIDNPFNRCVRTSQIEAFFDSKLIRPTEDKLIVNASLNVDLRVTVQLKDASGNVAARQDGADIVVPKGDKDHKSRIILTKTPAFNLLEGSDYSIEIVPSTSEVRIKNSTLRLVQINKFVPYVLANPDTVKVQPDDAGNVLFRLTTSARGTIEVFLNGVSFRKFDPNTIFEINISPDKLGEGANSIVIQGSSDELVPLSGKTTFPFTKESLTYLTKDKISFELREDILTLRYKLTRNIDNRWQFVDGKGNIGLGTITTKVADKQYEAKIDLSNANLNLIKSELEKGGDAYVNSAPVIIQIYNAQKPTEIIGEFSINVFKPTQKVKEGLDAAQALLAGGNKDKAKQKIAETFGLGVGTDEEKATIQTIIASLKGASSTKQKIYKSLLFAGKIAAGFFGIPLPF